MFNVDNSGKGNCLYYAYSISLMYYLRAKNNVRITEDIFNKLGLKEEDRARLRKLLSKDPDRAFTRDEIKTIIEPFLAGQREIWQRNIPKSNSNLHLMIRLYFHLSIMLWNLVLNAHYKSMNPS